MSQTETFDDLIRHLSDVLRQEKKQLLAGRYDQLSQVCALKERHLTNIETALANPDAFDLLRHQSHKLELIKTLAEENEKLLQATKAGVKSAQERMAHLKNIDSIVGTYTATGAQLRLDGSVTTCRKFA